MSLKTNLPEMPCGPYMELWGQRKRFHVPFGLKPLLEDMIVTVLKKKPDNIFDHLADFFTERVAKKDAEKRAKEEAEALEKFRTLELDDFVESFQSCCVDDSEQTSFSLLGFSSQTTGTLEGEAQSKESLQSFIDSLGTSEDEANHYATVIQKTFRGFMTRKGNKANINGEEEETYTVEEGEGVKGNLTDNEELESETENSEAKEIGETLPALEGPASSDQSKVEESKEGVDNDSLFVQNFDDIEEEEELTGEEEEGN